MFVRRKAVGDYILGRRVFEDGLPVRFEPCVTVDLAASFIAHAKYDACGNSVLREISMKHSRAFPANRLEDEDVCGEK